MTPQQLITLRAACFNDAGAAAFFVSPGDAAGLADYLNQDAINQNSPFVVWKTNVTRDELMSEGFDYTVVDNLTEGQARIWSWLFDNDARSMNPSDAGKRNAVSETWKGTAAKVANANFVLGKCKRNATRAEKAWSTGTGATAAPGLMTLEGYLSVHDVAPVIYRDDGAIWTAE